MIVAHLDLDAFFAAVEELEDPALRRCRSSSAATRTAAASSRRATTSPGASASTRRCRAAEALRRCPQAVFVRPRHSLYRDYSREVWSTIREIVPTVEQAGIDEGYLDLGEVAPAFDDARALAEAVQAVVRARTQLSCSLGVATSKVVAKVASDRRKPGGLTVVRPGREAAFLAPFPIRILPGVGPRAEERLVRLGHRDDRRHRGAHRRRPAARPAGQGRPRAARPGARHRPAPARGLDRAHLDLARGDVRARHRRPGAAARRAAAACRSSSRSICAAAARSRARSRRRSAIRTSRSGPARPRWRSAPTTRARIGELACSLLDRALRDRPGPLRLVGVGVSGLEEHVQLSLPRSSESSPAVSTFVTVSVYPLATHCRLL